MLTCPQPVPQTASSSPILSLTHFSQPPAATTLQRLLLPRSPVPSHKQPRALHPRAPLPRPSLILKEHCHTPSRWDQKPALESSCSNLLELLVISTFTGTLTAFLSVTSDLYRCHCLASLPALCLPTEYSLFSPKQPGEPLKLRVLYAAAPDLPEVSHQTNTFFPWPASYEALCGTALSFCDLITYVLSLVPHSDHNGHLAFP